MHKIINNKNLSTESKKLESNEKEIIWELKKGNDIATKLLRLWFYPSRLSLILFSISLMFYPADIRGVFVIMVFLFLIFYYTKGIPVSINFERLYLTNENLVIKRYFSKDIILPLGSFCVYDENCYLGGELILDDKVVFLEFMGNLDYYIFQYECKDYVGCDELNDVLKPYIINYFLSLKQEDYLRIKSLNKYAITKIPYFKEIEKMREEQKNNA